MRLFIKLIIHALLFIPGKLRINPLLNAQAFLQELIQELIVRIRCEKMCIRDRLQVSDRRLKAICVTQAGVPMLIIVFAVRISGFILQSFNLAGLFLQRK